MGRSKSAIDIGSGAFGGYLRTSDMGEPLMKRPLSRHCKDSRPGHIPRPQPSESFAVQHLFPTHVHSPEDDFFPQPLHPTRSSVSAEEVVQDVTYASVPTDIDRCGWVRGFVLVQRGRIQGRCRGSAGVSRSAEQGRGRDARRARARIGGTGEVRKQGQGLYIYRRVNDTLSA